VTRGIWWRVRILRRYIGAVSSSALGEGGGVALTGDEHLPEDECGEDGKSEDEEGCKEGSERAPKGGEDFKGSCIPSRTLRES
jgi:hypothetical protein